MMTVHAIRESRLNRQTHPSNSNEERLLREVVRLNSVTTGIAAGILAGLLIFVATLWLVIKGGPEVGPHLMLLSNYFPGYRVTLVGSFIGLIYGFITGFVAGSIIGWVYNSILRLRGR